MKVIFTAIKTGKYEIELTDMRGGILITRLVGAFTCMNQVDLNISNLADGNYFVSLISGNERRTVKLSKGR